jgi:hypothetical protein
MASYGDDIRKRSREMGAKDRSDAVARIRREGDDYSTPGMVPDSESYAKSALSKAKQALDKEYEDESERKYKTSQKDKAAPAAPKRKQRKAAPAADKTAPPMSENLGPGKYRSTWASKKPPSDTAKLPESSPDLSAFKNRTRVSGPKKRSGFRRAISAVGRGLSKAGRATGSRLAAAGRDLVKGDRKVDYAKATGKRSSKSAG